MSWAVGFDTNWHRDVGYGVPATCDHPGCGEIIDRGLGYVCGGQPYGGEHGCGLFFCSAHLVGISPQTCERCATNQPPFKPTDDAPEWTAHKITHPSWSEWRETQLAA